MPVDELYREVGDIVQKLTDIVLNFRRLGLTREEYVCLKVILLLTHGECLCRHVTVISSEYLGRFAHQSIHTYIHTHKIIGTNIFLLLIFCEPHLPRLCEVAKCFSPKNSCYANVTTSGALP